ncbi:hypothetical protein E2C01_095108 [Portunus trituberculatus]|uniref:Uncharacterized protein n=1 Tax=Portunus trituberculatus TaxID=210409 RepID=A0A5B7JNZ6_PORTR|nr:hypothetical protein [Portunus trituberculatus]
MRCELGRGRPVIEICLSGGVVAKVTVTLAFCGIPSILMEWTRPIHRFWSDCSDYTCSPRNQRETCVLLLLEDNFCIFSLKCEYKANLIPPMYFCHCKNVITMETLGKIM